MHSTPWRRRLIVVLPCALTILLSASLAEAKDRVKDFKQNCSSCHTIGGGRLTGPDLKNVEKRKDREWLIKFILDPVGVLDSGDAYAQKLLAESKGARMNPIAGMSRERAEQLLDLIAEESLKEKSQFAGLQLSEREFTPADVELGRQLFDGTVPLKNGGAACISCHTMGGLGFLRGGRLGPDLTKVFERPGYESRRKLGAWLSSPATETMSPAFRDHPLEAEEILPLVAYFKDAAVTQVEDTAPNGLVFTLLGLGGAVGAVLLLNRLWRGRFRAVRKPLIKASALPERRRA